MGGLEDQKMISRLRVPAWPRFVRLSRSFVRIALGILFVFAGATKAFDPGAFAIEIQRYQLIPWFLGVLASVYLPWLEILLGALLVLQRAEQAALL
jgi:putative oxidoreductase